MNPISNLQFEVKKKINLDIENAGLKLSAGFTASTLADSVGKAVI
jgi:hypothetical protein